MNPNQREKLARFINDAPLSQAVYDLLLEAFLKEHADYDVHKLAASKLAIDYLKHGWRELQKYKQDDERPASSLSTPHV